MSVSTAANISHKLICSGRFASTVPPGPGDTSINPARDGFSPALTAQELDNFYHGVATDPLVKKYQETLLKTDRLVLVFPIWFNEYPAIFKGFFDRVCQGTFAFDYVQGGIKPKLTHIQRALIVTTSHAPTEMLKEHSGNIIENQVIGHMLKSIGVSKRRWVNFGGVLTSDAKQQTAFISSLKQEIQQLGEI